MRRHQLKFHAFAISTIVAIVTMLFFLIGPDISVPESEQARGNRYIQVYSATWGANCNRYIDIAIKQQQQNVLQPKPVATKKGVPPAPQPAAPELKPVGVNNVLIAVSDRCNGRIACDMLVTSANLGAEPFASCYKRLLVSYRCFEVDRLRSLDIGQGEKLVINCRAEADEATGAVQ